MVLKIEPDRPVQPVRPSTGHSFGPVRSIRPELCRTGIRPAVRLNRPIPFKPDGSIIIFKKKLQWSVDSTSKVKKLPPPTRHDTDASSHRWYLWPLHRCKHPPPPPPSSSPHCKTPSRRHKPSMNESPSDCFWFLAGLCDFPVMWERERSDCFFDFQEREREGEGGREREGERGGRWWVV